jgi:hypothetical protein
MGGRRDTTWGDYRITESGLYLRDTTIANASTGKHGLLPKLSGSSTDVLRGDGTWGTVSGGSGGGVVVRERRVASASASLDFTTFLSGTYDKYRFICEGLVLSNSGAHLYLEVGTGGGPTYDIGNNYEWARGGIDTAGGAANDSGASGLARLFASMGTTAGWSGSFDLLATNLASTTLRKDFFGHVSFINSTPRSVIAHIKIQWVTTGTAVSAVRFIPSGGTITSGSITCIAFANS